MAIKKKQKKVEEGEDWMVTYADAITLLLCFFVVILRIADPSMTDFEEIRMNFMSEFTEEIVETPFSDIYDAFDSIIQSNQLQEDVAIEETPKGLILEVSSESIFERHSADIMLRARPVLADLAVELARFEYDHYMIEVEGHTDDQEIRNPNYDNNWELSTARSANVVLFFIEHGLPKHRLKASGLADAHPKVPNRDSFDNPIEENRAINRRIRIRLEKNT
jgi:chemotaxis protein MotB